MSDTYVISFRYYELCTNEIEYIRITNQKESLFYHNFRLNFHNFLNYLNMFHHLHLKCGNSIVSYQSSTCALCLKQLAVSPTHFSMDTGKSQRPERFCSPFYSSVLSPPALLRHIIRLHPGA